MMSFYKMKGSMSILKSTKGVVNLLSYSLFIYLFTLIKFSIMIIPVLIPLAYLTLPESKVLGYTQTSKGPNVVDMYGILQPLADSVKLFSMEMVMPNHVNIMLYLFSPMMSLSLSLIDWSLLPLGETSTMADMNLILLLMFAFSSISVYAMLISGWSTNSKYAFLGALSAAAQMISYEVCMGLMMINIMLCVGVFNPNLILITQIQSIWFWMPLLPAGLLFFMSCLAETNSAPFDLTEGESELVSTYMNWFTNNPSNMLWGGVPFCVDGLSIFLLGMSMLLIPLCFLVSWML